MPQQVAAWMIETSLGLQGLYSKLYAKLGIKLSRCAKDETIRKDNLKIESKKRKRSEPYKRKKTAKKRKLARASINQDLKSNARGHTYGRRIQEVSPFVAVDFIFKPQEQTEH